MVAQSGLVRPMAFMMRTQADMPMPLPMAGLGRADHQTCGQNQEKLYPGVLQFFAA